MSKSIDDIPDSWCYTNVKATETKYLWTITDFKFYIDDKPLHLPSKDFASILRDEKVIKWQMNLKTKIDNNDYISLSLCRLDNWKDVKPTVNVTFMIINSERQVLHSMNKIDTAVTGKELAIPRFIESNSQILKENQNLSILCYLKIFNSVENFSNEESLEELSIEDCPTSIINNIKNLNGNIHLSDCILIAQNNKFYVQKAILAARSKTFYDIFKKTDQNNTQATKIIDQALSNYEVYEVPLKPEILTEVLNFIYTGKITNIEYSTEDLLIAAHQYALPCMKKLCATHLGRKLTVDNTMAMLRLSSDCESSQLKQMVFEFMKRHGNSISKSSTFKMIEILPDDMKAETMRILIQK